jgi:1-acyl-sn-glycerol-3-phosphate acyltransferase
MSTKPPALIPADKSVSAPASGPFAPLVRAVCLTYLAALGWKVRGAWPGHAKCVLLAAPHTSNWDGFLMLVAAGVYQVKLRWMGKKSLTSGPFGWFLRAFGCIGVDRSAANDVVAQMRAVFAAEEALVLGIAPEGTRTLNPHWKRGYYHIAHGAGVPIVVSVLDYGRKTIFLAAVVWPTGNYEADFAFIARLYDGVGAKRPDQFSTGV